MKLVDFPTPQRDIEGALEVLESMKQAIISGEIVAFTAAGVSSDDDIVLWCGSTEGISKLRMIGALSILKSQLTEGLS